MNGLPYYRAYPRDFIEGTIGMSFELKGAYRLVLDLIYMQGGRLPDDARYISGLLGCSIRKWKSLRDELVAMNKLTVSGEFLTNYRAEKELETLGKLQDKQRENAAGPRKNKSLQKPRLDHTEPDTRKKEKATPSPKKNGTRIPDDWEPDMAAAEREGLSAAEATREARKFRNYWQATPGQRGVKLDWPATWRNWCIKAAESRQNAPRSPPAERTYKDVLADIRDGKGYFDEPTGQVVELPARRA